MLPSAEVMKEILDGDDPQVRESLMTFF